MNALMNFVVALALGKLASAAYMPQINLELYKISPNEEHNLEIGVYSPISGASYKRSIPDAVSWDEPKGKEGESALFKRDIQDAAQIDPVAARQYYYLDLYRFSRNADKVNDVNQRFGEAEISGSVLAAPALVKRSTVLLEQPMKVSPLKARKGYVVKREAYVTPNREGAETGLKVQPLTGVDGENSFWRFARDAGYPSKQLSNLYKRSVVAAPAKLDDTPNREGAETGLKVQPLTGVDGENSFWRFARDAGYPSKQLSNLYKRSVVAAPAKLDDTPNREGAETGLKVQPLTGVDGDNSFWRFARDAGYPSKQLSNLYKRSVVAAPAKLDEDSADRKFDSFGGWYYLQRSILDKRSVAAPVKLDE